jgi:hypothetical protein
VEVYKTALQEYGGVGVVDEFPIRRDVLIAEDRETPLKLVEPVLKTGYRGVSGTPREVLIVGGPRTASRRSSGSKHWASPIC